MTKFVNLAALLIFAGVSEAHAIGASQPNLAAQVLEVQDIRPLNNLWTGNNVYPEGIFLIDQLVGGTTWQFLNVDGATVTLRRLDTGGTFYFTLNSPAQFGVGIPPDGTANIYAGIIKATVAIITPELNVGTTVQAQAVVGSTVTVGSVGAGLEMQYFDDGALSGIIVPVAGDQGIALNHTGVLALNEGFGFVLLQDGQIIGFIASINEAGEQTFYIGGSDTPGQDGEIRFRGTAAGAFSGDVDIHSSASAGSAIHVKMPTHFHVQGEAYLGGAIGVADNVHGGSNGHTNDLACFKSNGNIGWMAQSGGTITTGVCN